MQEKECSMSRLLLIVDPQIDFINGSLPVPGAEDAMRSLARYISDINGRYAAKVITADCHPYHHSSFADCGGEWPRHCVESTVGAAITPELIDPLFTTVGPVTYLYKGRDSGSDQYSIFANPEAAAELRNIVSRHEIDTIDLCGIAGDVCVSATLADGVKMLPECRFNVLTRFSPSLDGGSNLAKTIKDTRSCAE